MEKKEKLKKMYELARRSGLCHTQRDFAILIGISPTNFSSAMHGDEKYLTDNLFAKIDDFFTENHIQNVYDNHGTVIQKQENSTTSNDEKYERILSMLEERDKQITSLIEQNGTLTTIIQNLTTK